MTANREYRLGVIGLSPGNGHPYSWAAIFNGYNREAMARCPFPVIPEYLDRQDPATMRLPGATVSHIWTQDPDISRQVAAAALIEHVAARPEDLVGAVDAVLLARDDGENHLAMARPFVEAGLPVLIDKPLTTSAADLPQFAAWYRAGKPIMSCSSARFAPSKLAVRDNPPGRILTAAGTTPKYWRTYGIHVIEAICTVMGTDIESVQNVGAVNAEIVHLLFRDGRHAVIQSFAGIAAGNISFYGEKGVACPREPDAFRQFRNMLAAFLEMVRSGRPAFDWRETITMARVVIGAQRSLDEGNRVVPLKEIST